MQAALNLEALATEVQHLSAGYGVNPLKFATEAPLLMQQLGTDDARMAIERLKKLVGLLHVKEQREALWAELNLNGDRDGLVTRRANLGEVWSNEERYGSPATVKRRALESLEELHQLLHDKSVLRNISSDDIPRLGLPDNESREESAGVARDSSVDRMAEGLLKYVETPGWAIKELPEFDSVGKIGRVRAWSKLEGRSITFGGIEVGVLRGDGYFWILNEGERDGEAQENQEDNFIQRKIQGPINRSRLLLRIGGRLTHTALMYTSFEVARISVRVQFDEMPETVVAHRGIVDRDELGRTDSWYQTKPLYPNSDGVVLLQTTPQGNGSLPWIEWQWPD